MVAHASWAPRAKEFERSSSGPKAVCGGESQKCGARSSKELKMEREPYGVEEFEDVEDDGEAEDQYAGRHARRKS